MAKKFKDQILTVDQAKELKFFCQNVVGVRQDFYSVMDKTLAFHERLRRLEKTCYTIEKFFGEQLESPFSQNPFKGGDNGNKSDDEVSTRASSDSGVVGGAGTDATGSSHADSE